MGTWGEGLYDNDGALDELADLVDPNRKEVDPARFAAHVGLLAWLHPVTIACHAEELLEKKRAIETQLSAVPDETREALDTLLATPEKSTEKGSRSSTAHAIIGGYSDGPRIDALLRFPGAQPVIDEIGEIAAKTLDSAFAPKTTLYEITSAMAALGVLVELAEAGFFQPARERVIRWRADFDIVDKATKSERGFWWKYVRRAHAGFELLAPGSQPPKKGNAARGVQVPSTAPPGERFRHPKFGVGRLVSRSGSGENERLELRFEDGLIRTVLARFVARTDD